MDINRWMDGFLWHPDRQPRHLEYDEVGAKVFTGFQLLYLLLLQSVVAALSWQV